MFPSDAISIFPSALTVCSNPPFSYPPCFLVTCISNCDVPCPCLPCFYNLVWNVLRALTVVLTMRCFHIFNHPSLCSPQMSSLPLQVFSLFVFLPTIFPTCFLVTCISNCDVPRSCLPCFSNLDWNALRAPPPFVRIAVGVKVILNHPTSHASCYHACLMLLP